MFSFFKRGHAIENSDIILNAILEDDAGTISEHISDEEGTKKYLKINLRVPPILRRCSSLVSFAAFFGSADVVDYLLGIGADVKQCDFFKTTGIFFAAAGGNLSIFKKFYDLDDTKADKEMSTPCMYAAMMGKIDIVKYIWSRSKDAIKQANRCGKQAIHFAAENGHINVVEFLLSQGVKVNEKDYDNATPLIYASKSGNVELVKFLIENKANVNTKTDDGMTALCYAARNGSLSVAKVLVENGAHFINKNDASPLVEACGSGHLDLVKLFVENGAKVNVVSRDGYSPLKAAIKRKRFNIFKYLLSKGAKTDIQIDKSNILEYACISNSIDIANYIVTNRIFSVYDVEPYAIDYCFNFACTDVLVLLINNGIDVFEHINISANEICDPYQMYNVIETLFTLMKTYEKNGMTKLGDILNVVMEMHDYRLLGFLYENRGNDFTIFNVGEEKLNELRKTNDLYSFFFAKEELLKDPKYNKIIADVAMNQNSVKLIKKALNHGIEFPKEFFEKRGILYIAFSNDDEELFNKLMEIGVDPFATMTNPLIDIEELCMMECFRVILIDLRDDGYTEFQLKAVKKIFESGVDVCKGDGSMIGIIFQIIDPVIIDTIKNSWKLTKQQIEDHFIVQRCIEEDAIDFFDWILSFKPNILTKTKPLTLSDIAEFDVIENPLSSMISPFMMILFVCGRQERCDFFTKMIDAYDFTGKGPFTDIYLCLMHFRDIKLFQKAKEHGVTFNNEDSVSVLTSNYAEVNKEIIDFYYENGVSPDDLSKENILFSYSKTQKVSRRQIDEVMNINKKEIVDQQGVMTFAVENYCYTLATIIAQLGFKAELLPEYFLDKLFNSEYAIYFVNAALDNNCHFINTARKPIVHMLLKNGMKNLFYILTKHGYKINPGRLRTSLKTCISLGKECGIPEEYIRKVYE